MATSDRIGTATNLQPGGTYDLLLVKFKGTFPEGEISFGLYDVPMKITGVQKVCQVFLKTLLTGKGSDPFYPQKGTLFGNLTAGANIVPNDARFLSDVKDSVRDASSQVKSSLNVNTTDTSSALDSVEILGVDQISEGLVLYLKLTTLAGEFASVAVPFPEFGLG